MTTVSITIPALNERNRITDLLTSFSQQSELDFEVTIVDNGSTDGTPHVVDQFTKNVPFPVRSLFESERGIGRARKHGMDDAASRGIPYLAGTDADSEVPPNWVATIKSQLATETFDCLFGLATFAKKHFENYPDIGRLAFDIIHYRNTLAHHITIPPRGVNFAITRKMYEAVGGISQPLKANGSPTAGEDIFLSKAIEAAGGRVGTLNATVFTDPRRPLAAMLANSFTDFHASNIGNPRNTDELLKALSNCSAEILQRFAATSRQRHFEDFIVNQRHGRLWEKAKVFVSPYESEFCNDAKVFSSVDLFKKYKQIVEENVERLNPYKGVI